MQRYRITDGSVSAVILPEKGATAVSLKHGETEFLYCWEENLQSPERPRCGIPFLFPTFGRMQQETYRWNGENYRMAIHGFGHTSPWSVESFREDSLAVTLEGPVDGVYPFDFAVRLTFRIQNGGLHIQQDYENRGSGPMPYAFGFHPYFLVEKLENAYVHALAEGKIDFATGQLLPFGQGTVTLREPESAPEVGAALAGLRSPVTLDIPAEHKKLTMEFSPDFPQLVLWHPKNAPFLCVEPINGSPNGFNTGNHLTLEPGQKKTVTLSLYPRIL